MTHPIDPKSAERYFEEEREYLRHMGRDFAAAHPGTARFLAGEGDDPSVERLLQGVAFLTSRIRQRLDQQLPELSHELFRVLWPHFLRPTPSLTMQRFQAPEGASWTLQIPAGTRIRSQPIASEDTRKPARCIFRTVHDVALPPCRLEEVNSTRELHGERLRLTFRLNRGLNLENLPANELDRLRLFIAGPSDGVARELLYLMLHHVPIDGAVLSNPDLSASRRLRIAPPRLVGLSEQESLLPGWGTTPEPYRLLDEFHAFPQKLLFVELRGLAPLSRLGEGERLCVELNFNREFAHRSRLRAEHLLLGCTPAINLFSSTTVFRRRSPAVLEEYPLSSRGGQRGEEEIFSVDEVSGVPERSSKRRIYRPLLERAMELEGLGPGSRWYQERVQVDPDRKSTRTALRLSLPDEPDKDETFSVKLTCSNGRLPMELSAGEVNDASGLPAGVETFNLMAPTPPIPPPLDRELEWRVLTHLAVSRSSLGDLTNLKRILTLYNRAAHARGEALQLHRRRMSALKDVRISHSQELVPWTRSGHAAGGAWCSGANVELSLDIARFGGVGEAFLFGIVMDEVLSHWVTLNAFSQLTLRDHAHGAEQIRFQARLGDRRLL